MDKNYDIRDSSIHGKGVFANRNIKEGETIGLGIAFILGIWPYITDNLGSMVNHCGCEKSNLVLKWDESDKAYNGEGIGWYLVAKKDIDDGAEMFLNYSNTPFYIAGPKDYYTC